MFKSYSEIPLITWAILAALTILGIVLFIITHYRRKWTTRMIANVSLCITLAFFLSYIKLYKMLQGGGVTLASMLPIFMLSYAYDVAAGLMIGFAYGLLQFVQGGWFVHPLLFLLDYPLAFAMLVFSSIARKLPDQCNMIPGILLGTFLCFFCAFLTGVFFWGQSAGEQNISPVFSCIQRTLTDSRNDYLSGYRIDPVNPKTHPSACINTVI